ncbi:rho GTPase-activating protein 15 isoform X2 [Pseudoliparis swirei]|uniref:rho GTPase-activating protein 15 isoform X2 n=1 Tax=Pseudoliparis swirei TaxID=2059687 RepID=UPI0024BEEE7B|nr:rho GTPase-activating protein 15 isoform X2 [Pseudoliparis swirei]
MAARRNFQSSAKQPPPVPGIGLAPQDAVQMRIKAPGGPAERLSQSRSMVLQESDLPKKPISRHRRNQSQHNVSVPGGGGGGGGGGVAVYEPLVDLKGEHMNVAKISESGKKQRKNWSSMWSVLSSDQMLLYKERQQETSLKTGSKPDVVRLRGASVEWTTEKSSRKNVFQIRTNAGSEYLIQADGYATASRWFNAVGKAADSSTKLTLRRSSSTEYLPRTGSLPGYGSASPSTKQRNPVHRRSINMFGGSRLKHSASDSTDKTGVKDRLKKFISRRPSMKTLKEKGLIKDRVFGCPLLALCEREGVTVPSFVHVCLEAVDKRGLEADGIYRVSGNLATVQKLRFIVDQEEDLDLDQPQWEDVHVVTGALKLFFRELPEPLVPFRFFGPFVEAVKIKESRLKVQAMKTLIQDLPQPNQDTMKVLFTHLLRVLSCSRRNLMSTQGLGIVFGPTLMWPELDAGNMAVNMVYQTQIVEFILIESQEIFSLDRK